MSDSTADSPAPDRKATRRRRFWIAATVLGLLASAAVGALLVSITQHKTEAKNTFVRLVEVGEDDTDPAKWGVNWPKQYDGYKRTALTTRTASAVTAAARPCPPRRSSATLAQAHVPGLRVLDRLPRPARPRLHAGRPGGHRTAQQAAIGLVPALPRVDHAALPFPGRRGRHAGLRGLAHAVLSGRQRQAARSRPRPSGELRRLPRPEHHGAAGHPARLRAGDPGPGGLGRAGAPPAEHRGVARGQARAALRPQHGRHAAARCGPSSAASATSSTTAAPRAR
jgi:hypothetical protein